MLPRLLRWRSTRFKILLVVLLGLALEVLHHQYYYYVPRPSQHLDAPFQVGCKEPDLSAPRENAAIIMLARNEDLESAVTSLQSLEDHFNRWFHYPVVFMNNGAFSEEFKNAVRNVVSGETEFAVIPPEQFGFPEWMGGGLQEFAKAAMSAQNKNGIHKAGLESYHHMCRFYSGKFYDVEALKKYKWYWRVEPHVQFSCAITYDPFVEMAKHKKVYGYTVALWELDNTVPELFRDVSEFKEQKRIRTTALWRSFIRPSWLPWPLRSLASSKPLHNNAGEQWNLCHFWSNFEIADMDFFRSQEHRELFEYLDQKGGFYTERWGDASVHALAAALLLEPQQLHHFQDFGYYHDPWIVSPANAPGEQLPESRVLGGLDEKAVDGEPGGVGCRCERKQIRNFQNWCINRVQRATHPTPWPNKMW